MTPEARQRLRQLLVDRIKYEQHPYTSPAGFLSIGFGRNLEKKGCTLTESLNMLDIDAYDHYHDLSHHLKFFTRMSENRQIALIDLCMPDGVRWVLNFNEMMLELEGMNYERAANALLKSTWAESNGERATRIANIIRTNEI
jgi:lysozyme